MIKNKNIFISPLDWGLGHATRCVPIIRQLLKNNNVVILGVTKTTSLIFNEEFPELQKIEVEPYAIRYSKILPLALKLVLDAPRIFRVIKKERNQLAKIIDDFKIDVVISDNRFGLYTSKAQCIYITHQLNLQVGILSGVANVIHHHFIKKFNAVWVPDFEEESKCLAGKLSRNNRLKNVTYIGAISRLSIQATNLKEFDYLCLLSGPEPLRTLLEQQLIDKAKLSTKQICIVRGTIEPFNVLVHSNVTVLNLPTANELSHLIDAANKVVCRSGYSTLMDLNNLNKNQLILIPTPGQAEQLYLAAYWQLNFKSVVFHHNHLNDFSFD